MFLDHSWIITIIIIFEACGCDRSLGCLRCPVGLHKHRLSYPWRSYCTHVDTLSGCSRNNGLLGQNKTKPKQKKRIIIILKKINTRKFREVFFFSFERLCTFRAVLRKEICPSNLNGELTFWHICYTKSKNKKKTIFAKISTCTFLCIFYTSVSRFGKTVLASWIWRTGIPKTGILKSKKIQTLQSAERKKWINLP